MFKLRTNVTHNGQSFSKGDECPKELAEEFGRQGLIEKYEAPPKPAASEPKSEKKEK